MNRSNVTILAGFFLACAGLVGIAGNWLYSKTSPEENDCVRHGLAMHDDYRTNDLAKVTASSVKLADSILNNPNSFPDERRLAFRLQTQATDDELAELAAERSLFDKADAIARQRHHAQAEYNHVAMGLVGASVLLFLLLFATKPTKPTKPPTKEANG